MAMDRYKIIQAVRTEIQRNGFTPHSRSGVLNTKKMNDLINTVAVKLMSQGFTENDVERAMVQSTKHLCAAWRTLDENSNYVVQKFVSSGQYSSDDANSPHDEGTSTGGSPSNGSGQSQGQSQGQDDGDGSDGNNNGDGQSQGQGQQSQGQGQGQGQQSQGQQGQGQGDGEPTDETVSGAERPMDGEAGGQMSQGINVIMDVSQSPDEDYTDDEYPDSEDYEPPSIWFKCVRIIKWNLAHPGEQKNIMLVGPKGIGKTKMVFELSKKFFQKKPYALTAPQSEYKISGWQNAMGREIKTPVTNGYVDDGCIILVDEIDRSDENAMIQLNMATANKSMDTPTGMIEQANGCTFIATANTSGTGATNEYNTAHQLDASTRDRWIYLLMKWDHNVALKVARGDETLVKGLEDWNNACELTQYTSALLSYRTITDILDLMDMGCFSFVECIQSAMLKYAIPKSSLMGIYDQMQDHYNKVAKAVKVIMDQMPDNDDLF